MIATDKNKTAGSDERPVWECAINHRDFRLSFLGCLVLASLGVTPVAYWLFAIDLTTAVLVGFGCALALAIWQEISAMVERKKETFVRLFDDRLEIDAPTGISIGIEPPSLLSLATIDPRTLKIESNPLAKGGRVLIRSGNGITLRNIDFPTTRQARRFVSHLKWIALRDAGVTRK